MDWPTAFLCTVAIELPLVALVAPAGRRRRAAVDSIAANLLTHPLAWFLFGSALLPWTVVEIGVAGAETVVYRAVTGLRWPRAIAAAMLANTVTATLSFVL
jgi:hypothetical protein